MMHAFNIIFPLASGFVLGLALFGVKPRSQIPTGPDPAAMRRAMSRLEALQLLGLDDEADPRAICAAYKRLIIRYHPDHGGSHQAAAKLNQAKDVLLGRA